MHLIDTHSHIHFKQFDSDREAVIARALEKGVGEIITLGTDVKNSEQALALAASHPVIFAAVGVHPSEAHLADADVVRQVRRLAESSEKVVAIGEVGLDFYWETKHHQAQYDVFGKMIDLAAELKLPVVIHSRSAHREIQWFLQERKTRMLHGVMHCFEGEVPDVRFYLELGLHISFTANITYEKFSPLQVVHEVPLNRVMIETDSPYIAPAGFRNKRNEPANVLRVAERLAEIHGLPVEEIASVTTENARRFFELPS